MGGGVLFPANLAGLNAFSLPVVTGAGARIAIEQTADGLTLTYSGTLQSANAVTGPYTNVENTTSPAKISFTESARFYRLKP